jgi:hypothetical protein
MKSLKQQVHNFLMSITFYDLLLIIFAGLALIGMTAFFIHKAVS